MQKLKVFKNEKKLLTEKDRAQNLAKRLKIKNLDFVRKVETVEEVLFYKAFMGFLSGVCIFHKVKIGPHKVDFLLKGKSQWVIEIWEGNKEKIEFLNQKGYNVKWFSRKEIAEIPLSCAIVAAWLANN